MFPTHLRARLPVDVRAGYSVKRCFVFFFQAEDGIRDLIVTGVQTCALPIWVHRCTTWLCEVANQVVHRCTRLRETVPRERCSTLGVVFECERDPRRGIGEEIGRASCRERV